MTTSYSVSIVVVPFWYGSKVVTGAEVTTGTDSELVMLEIGTEVTGAAELVLFLSSASIAEETSAEETGTEAEVVTFEEIGIEVTGTEVTGAEDSGATEVVLLASASTEEETTAEETGAEEVPLLN